MRCRYSDPARGTALLETGKEIIPPKLRKNRSEVQKRSRTPTLIIWGRQTHFFPLEAASGCIETSRIYAESDRFNAGTYRRRKTGDNSLRNRHVFADGLTGRSRCFTAER